MSNIKTEDILEESGLTNQTYNKLVDDDLFSTHKPVDVEDEYKEEQRKLASRYDSDDSIDYDFPNLGN